MDESQRIPKIHFTVKSGAGIAGAASRLTRVLENQTHVIEGLQVFLALE